MHVDEYVTSPTFTLINEYANEIPIYHFDFYRINSEDEVYGLGYEEYFYSAGICLIEWSERIPTVLPPDRIEVHIAGFFEYGDENKREITIHFLGKFASQPHWNSLIK